MANRNFLAYFFPEFNNMSLFFNKEKFDLSSFFKKIFLKNFQNLPKVPRFIVLLLLLLLLISICWHNRAF